MRLSLSVAVSFLLAWAALTAVVFVFLPQGPVATIVPWALGGVVLASCPVLALSRHRCPNLITLTRLLALAAVDCLAVGLALWLLLPGDVGFASFLPIFLLALGAGLVSGSPAGLRAFEIVLLAWAPGVAETDLLAGIVAWRVLYYGLPALIGAAMALASGSGGEAPRPGRPLPGPAIAEAGLVLQGDLFCHPAGCVAGRTAHGLVALSGVTDLERFRSAAQDEGKWPILYKVSGRGGAAEARKAGLTVHANAREAWLAPLNFRLDIPAPAGLRRKLRRADAAGVRAWLEASPEWDDLAGVNAAWVRARGAEHGFSMGRFDPAYLVQQQLIVARAGGRTVGFASFHVAQVAKGPVWTLDLLRPGPDAPEGTAQLLVATAISAAAKAGVRQLSLAAVPPGAVAGERGLVARMERILAPDAGRGLDQFKSGFAPNWQRLYVAGPSLLSLAIAGLEIWGRVRHPPALAKLSRSSGHDAEYEIASGRNPWQRGEEKTA